MNPDLFSPGFSSLHEERSWQSFAASYALQAVLIAAVVRLGVIAPKIVASQQYHAISLYLPVEQPAAIPLPPVRHIQPPPAVAIRRAERPALPLRARLEPPVPPAAPKIEARPAPPPVVAAAATPPPEPPKQVETGNFDSRSPEPKAAGNAHKNVETGAFSGSSAVATVKAAINKVQTGGFGDPNGVPAQNSPNKAGLQIAKTGSFDLPEGDGYGNGTGGKRGIAGTAASAGFGSGVAGPGAGDHNGGGRYAVKLAGFEDTQAAAPAPARASGLPAAPNLTPVEVLQKPAPAYTDEARKLHIEGEVLLEVQFGASGQLRVLRVVRGLGHGLDEAAMAAAQKIRYKPATRAGQPVDSIATLHIVFQIA